MQMRRASLNEVVEMWRRRLFRWFGITGVIFIASSILQYLRPQEPLVIGSHPAFVSIDRSILEDYAGSGLVFGILGGFRTITANIVWLRMNEAWEDRNLAETEALIRLALLIDPRPEVFWRTGAHTIGFDMPVWRIRSSGGESVVNLGIQNSIRREQMFKAIELLKQGASLYPDNPTFPIEIGKVYLNSALDFEMTIQYFKQAWEMPNAPFYIGRLLARVMETAGRPHEALEVLREDLKKLPEDDPEAYIDIVRMRIAELELKLENP
ncbi:MAG: tetratricopeptide repeat protein [Verrucomicrobiota bacterium]